jgi:GNAT superfamily N-acetyltransferase
VFQIDTPITEEVVERDGFGKHFSVVIAQQDPGERVVGFAAWQDSYDLHWGISGGMVLDLYADPNHRGYGLAPRMLSFVAAQVAENGGSFLAGQGIEGRTHPAKLYQKIAMGFPGVDCILGGRAFKSFALLHGKSLRELVKGLPPKEWNHLP